MGQWETFIQKKNRIHEVKILHISQIKAKSKIKNRSELRGKAKSPFKKWTKREKRKKGQFTNTHKNKQNGP